jgi:hypothetical protein
MEQQFRRTVPVQFLQLLGNVKHIRQRFWQDTIWPTGVTDGAYALIG